MPFEIGKIIQIAIDQMGCICALDDKGQIFYRFNGTQKWQHIPGPTLEQKPSIS